MDFELDYDTHFILEFILLSVMNFVSIDGNRGRKCEEIWPCSSTMAFGKTNSMHLFTKCGWGMNLTPIIALITTGLRFYPFDPVACLKLFIYYLMVS